MRLRIPTLFVLALGVNGCNSAPGPLTGAEKTAITREVTATLEGLTEAMNAHDPEQVFAFYRQEESFFYMGCTSSLYGWDTFATRVGSYYTFNTEVTFEQTILSVQVLSPTVAVAALAGSSTDAEALFWTEVLQKGDEGRWLITWEHESWPGCPVPKGPHMGTEAMDEWQEMGGDTASAGGAGTGGVS